MSRKASYLSLMKSTHERRLARYDESIKQWEEAIDLDNFFGYNSPGQPMHTAIIEGFLYQTEGDRQYAADARERLVTYRRFADYYPEEFRNRRAEYKIGLPPINSMFTIPIYMEAYDKVKDSDVWSDEDHQIIQKIVEDSAEAILAFPEWGSHNRCTLRAWSLISCANSFPNSDGADDWRQVAERMAADSIGRWSVEDAMLYHAIWLHSLMKYADAAGRPDYFREPTTRFYLDYFLNMMTPAKTLVDFGDSDWNSNAAIYLAVFERAAKEYRDPYYAWAAQSLFEGLRNHAPDKEVFGAPAMWMDAYEWCDDEIEPEEPHWRSRELLDEVVGKKVMFRSGWGPDDTALAVNFKPDTDYGMTIREYMHHTIPVHAEKDHHGHSDENSICILMSDGTLLLHDGGYREKLPNGKYRQDLYHNRTVVRPGFLREGDPVYPFLDDDGTHRPMETQLVDFHTFDQVDFSRSRAIDKAMGYQIDRTVVYLKPEKTFVVIDGLRFLRDGDFTVSTLYYLGDVTGSGNRWFDGDQGREMRGANMPKTDTSLLIAYPQDDAGLWSDQESVTRYFRGENMLHQTLSGRFHVGQWQVMASVLTPHNNDLDPEILAGRITIPQVSRHPQAAAVSIETDDGVITVGVKLDRDDEILVQNLRPRYNWESGRTTYGKVETDARFVWTRDRGDTVDYAVTEAVRLDWEKQTLFEAAPFGFALQYTGDNVLDSVGKWRAWQKLDVHVGG